MVLASDWGLGGVARVLDSISGEWKVSVKVTERFSSHEQRSLHLILLNMTRKSCFLA